MTQIKIGQRPLQGRAKLGQLHWQGRVIEIWAWANYGVVAPMEWTTNGSIAYVSRLISERVEGGGRWEPEALCGDGTVDEQLRTGYKRAFE